MWNDLASKLVDDRSATAAHDARDINPCGAEVPSSLRDQSAGTMSRKFRAGGREYGEKLLNGAHAPPEIMVSKCDPLRCIRTFVDNDLAFAIALTPISPGHLYSPARFSPAAASR